MTVLLAQMNTSRAVPRMNAAFQMESPSFRRFRIKPGSCCRGRQASNGSLEGPGCGSANIVAVKLRYISFTFSIKISINFSIL